MSLVRELPHCSIEGYLESPVGCIACTKQHMNMATSMKMVLSLGWGNATWCV